MIKNVLASLVLFFGIAVTTASIQPSTAQAGITIHIPTPGVRITTGSKCYRHRHNGRARHRHCGRHVHSVRPRHCHTRFTRSGRRYRKCHRHAYRH